MSYDVMIVKFSGKRPATPLDIEARDVTPLGHAADVRRRVAAAMPGTDWSDPTWGRYVGEGFSIELQVREDGPIDHITLLLRGGGDALAAACKVAVGLGCVAIDCQTDEFLDLDAPSPEGWDEWQGVRDTISRDRGGAEED